MYARCCWVTWMIGLDQQRAVHVVVSARFPHEEPAQRVEMFADMASLVEQSCSDNVQLTASPADQVDDAQRLSCTVHLRCHDDRLAADAEARRRHRI